MHFILFSAPYHAKIKSKAPVFTKPQTAIEKELHAAGISLNVWERICDELYRLRIVQRIPLTNLICKKGTYIRPNSRRRYAAVDVV